MQSSRASSSIAAVIADGAVTADGEKEKTAADEALAYILNWLDPERLSEDVLMKPLLERSWRNVKEHFLCSWLGLILPVSRFKNIVFEIVGEQEVDLGENVRNLLQTVVERLMKNQVKSAQVTAKHRKGSKLMWRDVETVLLVTENVHDEQKRDAFLLLSALGRDRPHYLRLFATSRSPLEAPHIQHIT